MANFFRRFFLGDYGPPPAPDITNPPLFSGETVVEILYSESKNERAIITGDNASIYRVYYQTWDDSDWDSGHAAFWNDRGPNGMTDSVEIARRLAREALHLSR
jgi:hypothetical protein